MVAPLVGVGAGLAAGGLAGSIFGRKSTPTFDPTQLYGFINQGAAEQKGYAGQLVPGVQANQGQFLKGIQGAESAATTGLDTASQNYLSQLDPITSRILQAQSGQLKQGIYGGIPEAQNAAREAEAAGGGLNRGAAAAAVARIPVQAAQQYGQGVQGLNIESLRAKQAGLQTVYSAQGAQIAQKLGIDQNTYQAILNSGNDALIKQLSDLIQISQTQTSGLVGVGEAAAGANIARGAADAQAQNAIYNSLTQTGGTLLGLSAIPNYPGVPAPGAGASTPEATPVPPVQTTPGGLYTSGQTSAPLNPFGTNPYANMDPVTLQILMAQGQLPGTYQTPQ